MDRDAVLSDVITRSTLCALVADYGHLLDWLEWHRLDMLFWPDAQFDFGMFKGNLADYRAFVVPLEEGYTRRLHLFATPSISARGNAARIDAGSVIVCRTDSPAPGVDDRFWGRYLFYAERREGEWRFSSLTYLLNLFDRRERISDDRNDVMHFADSLSPRHSFYRR